VGERYLGSVAWKIGIYALENEHIAIGLDGNGRITSLVNKRTRTSLLTYLSLEEIGAGAMSDL
jgi:hypothetical protein